MRATKTVSDEHAETARSQAGFHAALNAARKLSNKDLVTRVKRGFQKIAPYIPDVYVLRARFKASPRGNAKIDGCKTFKEFCERRLGRTYSHIAHLLSDFEVEAEQEPEAAPAEVKFHARPETKTATHADYDFVQPPPSPPSPPPRPPVDSEPQAETPPTPPEHSYIGDVPDKLTIAQELISSGRRTLAVKYHPDKGSTPEEKTRREEAMRRVNNVADWLLKEASLRIPRMR